MPYLVFLIIFELILRLINLIDFNLVLVNNWIMANANFMNHNLVSIFILDPLANLDSLCDCLPVVSTVTNLGDLFLKCVVFPLEERSRIQLPHFLSRHEVRGFRNHLDEKSVGRCILLLIPIIGQLTVLLLSPLVYLRKTHMKGPALEYIKEGTFNPCYVSDKLTRDWAFALAALKQDHKVFSYFRFQFEEKLRFIGAALKQNPLILKEINQEKQDQLRLIADFYGDQRLLAILSGIPSTTKSANEVKISSGLFSKEMPKEIRHHILSYHLDVSLEVVSRQFNQDMFEVKKQALCKEISILIDFLRQVEIRDDLLDLEGTRSGVDQSLNLLQQLGISILIEELDEYILKLKSMTYNRPTSIRGFEKQVKDEVLEILGSQAWFKQLDELSKLNMSLGTFRRVFCVAMLLAKPVSSIDVDNSLLKLQQKVAQIQSNN